MTIRVLGASHANCLRFAYELEYKNHPIDLQIRGLAALKHFHKPFHNFDGEKITFTNPVVQKGFSICFGTDEIWADNSVWGVVAGFSSVRIWAAWFWRQGYFVTGTAPAAPYHISSALITHMNNFMNDPWMQFLRDMRKLGLRTILVSTPPPILSHPAFAQQSDPLLAARVNRILRAAWSEFCENEGIDAATVPKDLCDPNGFLLPEYCVEPEKDDWTHGNILYGKKMLDTLLKAI